MDEVRVEKNTYTINPLYQWDRGQVLIVCGLSLAAPLEVHFAHGRLEDAIVRSATVDTAGVIRAAIPNELLEKAQPINAYICSDDGVSFKSLYKIVIPVRGRPRPGTQEEETDG